MYLMRMNTPTTKYSCKTNTQNTESYPALLPVTGKRQKNVLNSTQIVMQRAKS